MHKLVEKGAHGKNVKGDGIICMGFLDIFNLVVKYFCMVDGGS